MQTLKETLEQNAEKYRHQTAFQTRTRKFSFEQVLELTKNIQSALVGMGAGYGDRVAILSENRPEWPIAYLAITSMGAVAVPLDAMLSTEEILSLLEDSEAKAIVLSEKFADAVRGTRCEGRALLMEKFDQLGVPVGDQQWQVKLDDLAAIVYTSGTTGVPKGVMLTHRNIMSNVSALASLFDVGPGDNFLSVLPLHHTFETTAGFLCAFYTGCTITYAQSLKSNSLLRDMRETGVTVMCGVPLLYQLFYEGILREAEDKKMETIFWLLFQISKFFHYVIGFNVGKRLFALVHQSFGGKIRFFVSGGAALDPEIARNFDLMGFTILQGYGLTESAPVLTCNTLQQNKIGSVGKALPGVEIKIAGTDAVGEILAFGPNIMKGYYKRRDLTAPVIVNGWLHTGDVGYLDEEGYLFITGRSKEVIVTASGVNVYPDEIEYVLNKTPGVKEACVFGAKIKEGIRRGTEEVVAVIVPADDSSEEEVKKNINALNAKLADHKRVARIIFRKEEMPKTRLKKIRRFVLKKEVGL